MKERRAWDVREESKYLAREGSDAGMRRSLERRAMRAARWDCKCPD
jgi:hypothetical protein